MKIKENVSKSKNQSKRSTAETAGIVEIVNRDQGGGGGKLNKQQQQKNS